ncbi:hypothetical protein V8B55DRAFT_1348861 [Mucor lusitanicus]|uniref:Uncharacterized protein n=1 Tax=Mucor lusitanicus CBS 277.49 TaxID=747725 RepID=A0A168JQF2_MUCCL|nr:hypothetical protein MUCCIDRAFT_83224 [Mucor lusitanicus CBS 277.49]
MSIKPTRSILADLSTSQGKQHPLASLRSQLMRPLATITQTDYVTSTITASSVPEPTTTSLVPETNTHLYAEDVWEHRIHRYLPVILAFAIIGILTVLGSLIYLAYRLYQASAQRRRRRRQQAENNSDDDEEKKAISPMSATLSNIIPWLAIPSPTRHPTDTEEPYVDFQPQQREPIRFEKSDLKRIMDDDLSTSTRRPSLAPSWLAKLLPSKFSTTLNFSGPSRRHMSLPILFSGNDRQAIDNLNIPISSTFVPIDKSSLTLVPRSEIWLDPHRRRGVDELDMWERKNSGTEIQTIAVPEPQPMWRFPSQQNVYPDSPESFERRYSLADRRSVHIDGRRHSISHRSSTTTMQEPNQPSRSRSESTRYMLDDSVHASTSNAARYNPPSKNESNDAFSKFEITVKLPKSKQDGASDVRLARQALETSRLKNSSSQWLHSSGSKSF